ncbi:UDP-2,3-diacylglucosamine diphosphatase [Leptospira ognonensis]|uniref:UDP-2,3-diacylglucosamine diphosphatase n=1 Tax=Leptospira ognonensis TaxID=2484945 RepID=A0A4R9K9C4_9LEPT|nr:UDP-2,3-diacylglucosamine diphosphatase [Leptospira ognonensis]TGL62282.1 UDP-2,3-diacylglucosamine diphosphatase [Leptospira ognonensis]
MKVESKKKKFKSVFISDLHLGTSHCKASFLLELFKKVKFENLFLIGDIVDLWALNSHWYWNKDHGKVIEKILKYSRKKRVQYILGNHDMIFRNLLLNNTFQFGEIPLSDFYIYNSVKGKRLLLIHGDQFDGFMRNLGWLYHLGDKTYDLVVYFNTLLNKIRKLFGKEYWSLSGYLKSKVKTVLANVTKFETILIQYAKDHHVDGVICGHTHTPSMTKIESTIYMNDGDWVDSCTFIGETMDGNFILMDYKLRELARIEP